MKVKTSPKTSSFELDDSNQKTRKKRRKSSTQDLFSKAPAENMLATASPVTRQNTASNWPRLEKKEMKGTGTNASASVGPTVEAKSWNHNLPMFSLARNYTPRSWNAIESGEAENLLQKELMQDRSEDSTFGHLLLIASFPAHLGGATNLGSLKELHDQGVSQGVIRKLVTFDRLEAHEELSRHRIIVHGIFDGFLPKSTKENLSEWIVHGQSKGHLQAWAEEAITFLATKGNEQLVSFLLDNWGGNANAVEYDYGLVRPALTRAILSDSVDMVKLLLDRGADPLFSKEVRDPFYNEFDMIYIPWDFVNQHEGGEPADRPEILRMMRASIEASGRAVPELKPTDP